MDEESRKLEQKRKSLLVQIVIVIIGLVTGIILNISRINVSVGFVICVASIIGTVILCYKSVKLISNLKYELMISMGTQVTNFKFSANEGISRYYYDKTDFIKHYDTYSANNLMLGKLENHINFSICDLLLADTYTDSDGNSQTRILFSGVFGMIDYKENNNYYIRINPDIKNKFLNQMAVSMRKMVGVKNIVRLENAEFERYFEVYSDNQIEARKVITVEFMEKLLKLRKKIKEKITIIYKDGFIFFFVCNMKLINERKLILKGVCPETKNYTYNNLRMLIETMNLLH